MLNRLPYFNSEEPEVEDGLEYEVFRLDPEEDEMYDEHADYLEAERGMSIDRDFPIIHVTGNGDTSIYAGPEAGDLLDIDYDTLRT